MNFSDINFNKISEMLNNLSESEKEQIDTMANNMMNQMRERTMPVEEEEEIDFRQGLHLSDEYDALDGAILDHLEQAWDLEDFYDGEPADYSASVLFLQKALLKQLRLKTENTAAKSLAQIAQMEQWQQDLPELMQVQTALFRAEYDEVSYEQLQALKDLVLPLLLKIANQR